MLAAVAMASVCMAGTVNFTDNTGYIYLPHNGVGGSAQWVPAGNNWVIALYLDNPTIAGTDPYDPTVTPLFTVQGNAWASDGYYVSAYNTPGSIDIFARIYNSSAIGTATEWVNTQGSVFSVPDISAGNAQPVLYDTLGTAPDGSDWKPIPEPTTLALFGLGLLTLGIRKRLAK